MRRFFQTGAAGLALVFVLAAASPAAAGFGWSDYALVLKGYVDDRGLVDYRGLKANRARLDKYISELGRVDPKEYDRWSREEKIAFWINAYNGLTLRLIVDNYPIESSFFKSLIYPKNSIRQIDGAWDSLDFEVLGRRMTLDDIENGVLRGEFDEPRIHMALVCASRGCPPLRNEPYRGRDLDRQLDDQTRRFLAEPDKFRIDRKEGDVYLSPIFKWFGADFLEKYGTDLLFKGRSAAERAVLNFIAAHLVEKDRDYLLHGDYSIHYLDYDWSLNEQGREKS